MKNFKLVYALFCGLILFSSCSKEDPIGPSPTPMEELEPEELDLPAAGLLAYFNFNDNVDDQSGNDHHGIRHGGSYVADRDGAEEGAYHLALGDYIQLPKNEELALGGKNPYSIGAFVKFDSLRTEGRSIIISKFNGGVAAGWYLGVQDDGTIWAYRNSAPWALSTDTKIQAGTYYFLLSTFDGERLRIYIDGDEIRASNPWSSHPYDTTTPTLIGASHSQHNVQPSFSGTIDDIIIYDRALTQTEISNILDD